MDSLLCAVTYTDEITVNLALESLRSQPFDKRIVLINQVSPMRRAFNTALDRGEGGCDYLLILAADTILKPDILPELIMQMDDDVFMVTGVANDIFQGYGSGGFFLLNMKTWDNWRFGEGKTADLDLLKRVEALGYRRVHYQGRRSSTHHPVWTPLDMFGKIRFSLQKWLPEKRDDAKWIFGEFFERELEKHPDNFVLQVGADLYDEIMAVGCVTLPDKDPAAIRKEYREFCTSRYPVTRDSDRYFMEGWEPRYPEMMTLPWPDKSLYDEEIHA